MQRQGEANVGWSLRQKREYCTIKGRGGDGEMFSFPSCLHALSGEVGRGVSLGGPSSDEVALPPHQECGHSGSGSSEQF